MRSRAHALGALGVLAALAACWMGDPPPGIAPPPPPPHARPVARAAPLTRPAAIARRIELGGASELPTWIAGAVAVFDRDTGVVSTLCGADAERAAREWATQLTQSEPGDLGCAPLHSSTELLCGLRSWKAPTLLYVDDLDPPHLVGAIVGVVPTKPPSIGDMRDRAAAASCAPVSP